MPFPLQSPGLHQQHADFCLIPGRGQPHQTLGQRHQPLAEGGAAPQRLAVPGPSKQPGQPATPPLLQRLIQDPIALAFPLHLIGRKITLLPGGRPHCLITPAQHLRQQHAPGKAVDFCTPRRFSGRAVGVAGRAAGHHRWLCHVGAVHLLHIHQLDGALRGGSSTSAGWRGGQCGKHHIGSREVGVGQAPLFQRGQGFRQGPGQRQALLGRQGLPVQHHLHPGGPVNPGHQHGVNQIRVLAQQVAVALGGEHRAPADPQAGQIGIRRQFVGHAGQCRKAVVGFENLEGRGHSPCLPATGRRGQGIDDALPALLAIGNAGRRRMFSDVVGDAVDV